MKTIFRVLMFGMMLSAVSTVSVFAQDVCAEVEPKQALYKTFTDNYAGTIDQQKKAVEAGDQYISKYGACAEDKDIVAYLNTNLPKMKTFIKGKEEGDKKKALYTNFDKAIDASNTAGIFTYGKEILAQEPDFVDVTIAMASAGFDQSVANPPVDTFSNDTITYSKMAIQQIEAGKPSKTGNYGVKKYSYKTKEFPDGKSNALGLMNYNIGYILYSRQGKTDPAKKKEALPYFYKSTQYNAFSKTDPFVYQTIGAWYLDEAIKLDAKRTEILKTNSNKETDETSAIFAMSKGYVDRAIDAYARAYKLASAPGGDAKRKQSLYDKLKELFAFRYEGKTEGVDAFVASVMNNPMPDPTTEPTPVKEATTTTSTTSGGGSASTMTSDTTSENTASMAKPTATKTSAASDVKAASNGAATAKTKAVAKKPAPKKKGTR